ncbi:uncharacterized protein LOC144159681 [Haemaphysalis longicornis]
MERSSAVRGSELGSWQSFTLSVWQPGASCRAEESTSSSRGSALLTSVPLASAHCKGARWGGSILFGPRGVKNQDPEKCCTRPASSSSSRWLVLPISATANPTCGCAWFLP